MKNKQIILVTLLCSAVIAGCSNKLEYTTALKDPITLNLVKQSIGNSMTQPYSTAGQVDYVHNYYNSCEWFSLSSAGAYRQTSCDALDLRLKNQKLNISSSKLVDFYMNELSDAAKKVEQQSRIMEQKSRQEEIENLANGK